MKPRNLLFLAVMLCCSIQLYAQQHPLVGTWEMVSGKATDADGEKMSFDTTTGREIKIITPTHYMLIAQDVRGDSVIFNRSLAGTVRIEGNRYIETPTMSSDEENTKIKTDFTWKVEGDRFIQQGTIILPDGEKVILDELVFQRVKSDNAYTDNPSVGVWDQLSSAYTLADGSQHTHTNATATRFHIITPTHWMRMSHRNNEFEHAMGGVYTMKGDTVYLDIDYASFPINPEETYQYTQRVEGDKLYVDGFGKGADGKKILQFEDVFQRVDADTDEAASNK